MKKSDVVWDVVWAVVGWLAFAGLVGVIGDYAWRVCTSTLQMTEKVGMVIFVVMAYSPFWVPCLVFASAITCVVIHKDR